MGPVAKAVQLWGLASEVALAAGVALAPLGALGLVPLGLVGRLVGGGLVQAVLPAAVLLKKQKSKSAGGMEFYQLPEPAKSFTWFAAHLGLWPTILNYLLLDRLGLRSYYSLIEVLDGGAKVYLGGMPFRFHARELRAAGVRGAVNCCEEWEGGLYAEVGIEQVRLETVDFCDPSEVRLRKAVEFLDKHVAAGHSVYIHCKAGVGRSTAVAVAYLASRVDKYKGGQLGQAANAAIKQARPPAAGHMYQRPSVIAFLQSQAA